jgi:L-iditol 2-dehydrogenase
MTKLDRPFVLGHEAAGLVLEGPHQGQKVAIDPAIPDLTCRQCRSGYQNLCPQVKFAGTVVHDGALCEFLSWPSVNLIPLPDRLSDAECALLEPLGVAVHALDLGHLRVASTAAVIGCGPVGLLLIQLLRGAGVASVVAFDPLPHRREAACRSGATAAVDPASAGEPSALRDLVGDGVDTVFEVVSAGEAIQLAVRAVRPGGRVVLVGLPGLADTDDDWFRLPASICHDKGLTFSVVRRMNQVYLRAISLVMRGQVDLAGLVTDRFPLSDVVEAFDVAVRRGGLKVVVEPAVE